MADLRHLGAPERLWAKVPTADLLDQKPGQPDEVELGLSYDHIDDYLEGRDIPPDAADRIERIWTRTRHKRAMPVMLADTWWRTSASQELPQRSSTTPQQQHEGQRALLVIDMQNSYFELPGLKERRNRLLPPVKELIRAAQAASRPVLLVRTQHQPDRSTWTLNMLRDDQGFAYPGTREAQFVDGLAGGPYTEIVKTRDSSFHRTDLRAQLERGAAGVEQVRGGAARLGPCCCILLRSDGSSACPGDQRNAARAAEARRRVDGNTGGHRWCGP